MKHSLSLFAVLCCVLHPVATRNGFAQTTPPVPVPVAVASSSQASLGKLVPRPERLEGALSVSRSGVTTRATLQFQAPDTLRIDVPRDDAIAVAGATYLSRGGLAQSVESGGRVRQWRYGSATDPWRSDVLADAGPANLTLFGWPQNVDRAYQVSIEGDISKADGGFTVTMQARAGVGVRMVADGFRSGDRGPQLTGGLPYFNTFKRTVFDRPFRIVLRLSPKGALLSREDRDEANRVLRNTEFERDAQGLLLGATVRDAGKRLVEEWKYDLKPRADAFAPAVFDLGEAVKKQIVEDVEPLALSAYEGQTADALFNRGVVLWRQAEDYRAALESWDAAARLKPEAVAPPLAIFEAAMRARDLERAPSALAQLASLRGANDFGVLARRGTLEIARHNWSAARAALDAAQQAQPLNLTIMTTRANLARVQGDDKTARALFSDILSSAARQPELQAAAAESLASLLVVGRANAQIGDDAFALLPKNAAAAPDASTGFYMQVVSALAQERAGRDAAAIKTWQSIASNAPGTLSAAGTPGTLAREHLIALQARRGDVQASLRAFRTLMVQAPDETARERARDTILNAWHKAFRGGELRSVLKQIASATSAEEEDVRLWLAWQERYAAPREVEAAIRSGAARFSRSPWWRSRLSDLLAENVTFLTEQQDKERERLSRNARVEAERAAKLDPSQPYYAVQSALALVQRAVALQRGTLQDLALQRQANDAARKALDALARAWPNDPEIAITIAMSRDALVSTFQKPDTGAIAALEAALRRGAPSAEGFGLERHAAVFLGRQMLASMLGREDRPDEAARQLEILLDAARDSSEEIGIAVTLLALEQKSEAAPTPTSGAGVAARLLRRLASEAGTLESADENARVFAGAVLQLAMQAARGATPGQEARMPMAMAASELLRGIGKAGADSFEAGDAASILAAAQLHFTMRRLAEAKLKLPEAPASWDRFARETETLAASSIAALQTVANGPNTLLASRAAALLSEEAIARGDASGATQWLSLALRGEPQSLELRSTLARVLLRAQKPAEALTARDDILRALPPSVDVLRRAGVLSASLNRPEDAVRFATQSLNVAQTARDVSIGKTQGVAFSLAHILLAQNQFERAASIYTGLSADQWPLEDRLAALLDWESRLRSMDKPDEAARIAAQATALRPTKEDLETAQNILNGLQ